jgi:hypothetical protein
MARKTNNRKKIHRLWDENKYCHWCSKATVLQDSGTGVAKHHTATFDHLYHRTEPERWKPRSNRYKGVLACYECNQKRGREAHIKTLPLWHQWLIRIRLHKYVYHIKRTVFKWYRSKWSYSKHKK